MRAAVHNDLETSGFRSGGSFLVNHAELHPHRFRAHQDRLLDRLFDSVGSTKDIDDVDRNPDLGELPPDEFPEHMLASDLRIHREHSIAPVLEEPHDPVGGTVRPVGRTDDGNRTSPLQKLGDVIVASERNCVVLSLCSMRHRLQQFRGNGIECLRFSAICGCRRLSGVGGLADLDRKRQATEER